MKLTKEQIFDFAILTLRWYLAFYMFSYGFSKITGGQFGIDSKLLAKPLGEVDKFHLAWYLFGLSKWFDISIGLIQIIGAILIVINRTALIGALLLLPILGQIFLVDIAFTTELFGTSLPVRLAGMIASDLLILYYYKERIISVWHTLTDGLTTKFKYKWWVYIILPFLGLATDFIIALMTYPVKVLALWLTK